MVVLVQCTLADKIYASDWIEMYFTSKKCSAQKKKWKTLNLSFLFYTQSFFGDFLIN